MRNAQMRAAETGPESTASGGMNVLAAYIFFPFHVSFSSHPLLPVFQFRALHDTQIPAIKDETTGTRLLRTCGVIKVLKYIVASASVLTMASPPGGAE